MKLQVAESVQNLALCLVQVFCYFLKIFKVCRMFEKVAKHRSTVSPPKQVSLLVVRAQMAGCFKKLLSGPLKRDGGISDYAQSLIQDTIYKPSTTRTNKAPILGC